MRKALTLLIALLSANLALAQNTPLACQVDAAAGLKWETGLWKTTRFIERKFILILSGTNLTKESVSKVMQGVPADFVTCTKNSDSSIFCSAPYGDVLFFNPKTYQGGRATIFGSTQNGDNRDTIAAEAFTYQPY